MVAAVEGAGVLPFEPEAGLWDWSLLSWVVDMLAAGYWVLALALLGCKIWVAEVLFCRVPVWGAAVCSSAKDKV